MNIFTRLRRWLFGEPAAEPPPFVPIGEPGWLEWRAYYSPSVYVRMAALSQLIEEQDRSRQETRLRQIIAEELQKVQK